MKRTRKKNEVICPSIKWLKPHINRLKAIAASPNLKIYRLLNLTIIMKARRAETTFAARITIMISLAGEISD